MTLSVCCLANDPPHRVAAQLGLLRKVADEIVVAVDSRLDPSRFRDLERVADRVLRVEVAPPYLERALGWLQAQCRGAWILRLDGDEFPSSALIRRLPDLIARDDILQYYLTRRWLFPDADHWIDQAPWSPDWQIRLVRNSPAASRVVGTVHTSVEVRSPALSVDAPMYHLDALVKSPERRAAKAAEYETWRPGTTTPEGEPLNETMFLPEGRSGLALAGVPPDDAALVRRVLDATPSSRPTRRVPVVTPLAEADRFWPGRSVEESAYRSSIEVWPMPATARVGTAIQATVRVVNRGTETWPWGQFPPLFRVGGRWFDQDGTPVAESRGFFSADVAPGDEILVPMVVAPPPTAGVFRLEVGMLHEGVCWFGDLAVQTVSFVP